MKRKETHHIDFAEWTLSFGEPPDHIPSLTADFSKPPVELERAEQQEHYLGAKRQLEKLIKAALLAEAGKLNSITFDGEKLAIKVRGKEDCIRFAGLVRRINESLYDEVLTPQGVFHLQGLPPSAVEIKLPQDTPATTEKAEPGKAKQLSISNVQEKLPATSKSPRSWVQRHKPEGEAIQRELAMNIPQNPVFDKKTGDKIRKPPFDSKSRS